MTLDNDQRVELSRHDSLEEIFTVIGNSGSDEHSQILQSDHAITPGGKEAFQHLLGTCVIAPELAGEVAYLIADAYADGEVVIKELPIENMEYGGQLAIATMQVSNSINGRNQDVKAKMIGGFAAVRRTAGRWSRRGKGYEGGDE